MKKKIIGISIAMLFAANGAIAQTSVTLYGTVDAGISYQNGASADGKSWDLSSGQQSYSRVGFRGTEDLGRGMKAIFLLEQGVQIDTGTSGYSTIGSGIINEDPFTGAPMNNGTFSSQTYVGVSSNYAGTLKLGRQFTPLYKAYEKVDPFKNGFAANINNFFGNLGNFSPYQRMDNAMIYDTPDMLAGFNASLAYGFGEVPGSTNSGSQYGVSVGYDNGPFTIVYAFHHANNDTNFLGLLTSDPFKTHFIGGAVSFGMLKVHAAFDQNRVGDDFKTHDYMLGVTVPFGMHTIMADVTYKQDKIFDDANASQFGIAYTYNLSKRSNLYAAYTHVRNDDLSNVGTEITGNNVNTFQVGMRHMF